MSDIPPHIVGAVISTLIMVPMAYSAGLRLVSAMIFTLTLVAMLLAQTQYFAVAPYVFSLGLLAYILCVPKILKGKSVRDADKTGPTEPR